MHNGPRDVAWAASKATASPIERESPVAGQAGRSSLARWQLRGGGQHAPMQPQGQEIRSTGRADGRGSQPIRNYNTYLWYLQILMPRRSTDQIIAQILEVCLKPGVAKTNVVYRANLNFKTILPYLDLLTRGKLLEAVPGKSTIYKTTAKGRKALKALRAIEEIIPERLD